MSPQAGTKRCQVQGWGTVQPEDLQALQSEGHGCSLSWRDSVRARSWLRLRSRVRGDRARPEKGWSRRHFELELGLVPSGGCADRGNRATPPCLGNSDYFCAGQFPRHGPTSANLAHLLALPPTPTRHTHAAGRGPGTPEFWGASPGGPDGAGRTRLFVDAGSFPPWLLRARWTMEPSFQ